MRIAFYQMHPLLGEVEKNLELIESGLSDAKADLIVLPELATTGYMLGSRERAFELAEPVPGGNTFELMRELASRLNAVIVTGMAERDGEKVYNSALAVLPDGSHHVYRKTHLFFEEKELFDPGDTGFFVFDFRGVKIGMMICFDWIFPESARELALQGAQIIAHPANLVLPYCQKAMITRCLENRLFAVTANRYGRETDGKDTLEFTGQSQITGPRGDILLRAETEGDMLGVVEIDPEEALNKWITPKNHVLEDRRVELYRNLCPGTDHNDG